MFNFLKRKTLKAIEFTAVKPDGELIKTEFKLGMGPCGKEVVKLSEHWSDFNFCVTQVTSDGETKEFWYAKHTMVGRFIRTF
ncbi:hypothetical protein pEp_SNUABM12_00015 [Erwinia phage pEp_SNUABM_12]|uniref:Uncharacterized protein n=1 Tax=Erwinia phage pEp_SNUABM_12 TaxID=2772019 RepID=A0A7L7SNL6_9CAUD|nr:hypothetical protein pEp_SNUABM12_00015 [Erwinia phage pEp_SNUABM_12]